MCLISLFLFCCSAPSQALELSSRVLCRPELDLELRARLTGKLRQITGWSELDFDEEGALHSGQAKPLGGSAAARELLGAAMTGRNVMVLEDASNRFDVVFCRVVEARWKTVETGRPPVYLILIDFADFSHLMGDRAALEAFNVGWGLLHEINHVVHDSADPEIFGEAGECEEAINNMRRECGLAERAEYFFTFMRNTERSEFSTRYVRLAFDRQASHPKNKKRYWLVWDASVVGGLDELGQTASAGMLTRHNRRQKK